MCRFATACLNSSRITNAMQEAAPHLTLTIEQMDQHHNLLNFLDVTVDLRTGTQRAHDRIDYITKLVPYAYNPTADCPLLRAFMTKMLPGQEQSIRRRLGYSFTGLVHEKIALICYGPNGNNGKTCLLHTIYRVLGKDYAAAVLPIEALTEQNHNSNNVMDALAALRGARFVRVTEADERQRLSEAQLKRICQGMEAPIQAARKFEHVITFPETHKIWLDCNHLPAIRGTDNAIWDRLGVIPFNVTLTEDEIDHELPSKLLEEAEGILAFGVVGAVEWFQQGLDKPAAMRDARDQWRHDSDQIGRFVEECCVVGSFAQAKVNQLYVTNKKWAEDGGEKTVLSHHNFGHSIISRGFTKGQNSAGFYYTGIGLATSQGPAI
jgi:putative DNA primase/helicase